MTTEQPEALQLADDLDAEAGRITQYTNSRGDLLRELAAAELRRQHAEIETLRAGYSAARLEIANLQAQLEAIGAGGVEPLRKRCLTECNQALEIAGLRAALTKANSQAEHFEREWYLRGDALEAALSATLTPPGQAQDAERYRWLRDHRGWQVLHRIRPGKSIEYRMRDDGDWWGHWWPTHEQAIDAARAAQKVK